MQNHDVFFARRAAALLALSVTALLARGAARPQPEMPEVLPSCNYPQPFNVPQSLGNTGAFSYGLAPAIAWNGTDYASFVFNWNGNNLRFQHLYADGSSASAITNPLPLPLGVTGSLTADRTGLVWNGNGYAATWAYYDNTIFHYIIAFALLSNDGAVIGRVQRASFIGATPATTYDALNPAVAYNAYTGNYIVVWSDRRSGNADIYASVFNSTGALSNAGAHDILISRNVGGTALTNDQNNPRVASSQSSLSTVQVVWQDARVGVTQIYGRGLDLYTDGTAGYVYAEAQMTNSSSGATFPALTATTDSYGLAWQDTRFGGTEILAARLDGAATGRTSPETRVTNTASYAGYYPSIAWTGSEFGIGFEYITGNSGDLWFARLSATGAAVLGAPVQITTGWLGNNLMYSELAFGKNDFVATIPGLNYAGHYAVTVGCAYDYSPPPCAGNFRVTAANSNGATFAWDPVVDPDGTDVAYYEIMKNGQSVGRTSGTQSTVTGLSPLTAAEYELFPVDADQRRQASCTPLSYTPPNSHDQCGQVLPLGAAAATANNNFQQWAVVSNGTDFASAYADTSGNVWFQRWYADGKPRTAPLRVVLGDYITTVIAPGLVWNGNGYGLAWGTVGNMNFAKLNSDGAVISAPVTLNLAPTAYPYSVAYWQIALAWSGSNYAAVWVDYRNNGTTGSDIYATLLKTDGTIAGPTANYSDIIIANATGNQDQAVVAWSPYAGKFVIAFDQTGVTPNTIQTVRLDPATGTADTAFTLINPPTSGAFRPSLGYSNYYVQISWQDTRNGVSQIFTNTLTPTGDGKYYTDAPLTPTSSNAYNSSLAPIGNGNYGDFYVTWNDTRNGPSQLYLQKINYGYYPVGPNTQVSGGASQLQLPRLAANPNGVLVAGGTYASPSQLFAVGCVNDATPPSCPANLQTGGVTAGEATLSWQASVDAETGVFGYNIYRNSTLLTQTTSTSYTDAGLAAGASYAYMVQPVNGGGIANTGCMQNIAVNTPSAAGACGNGQTAAQAHAIGGATVPAQSVLAWNGSEFAVAYGDLATSHLFFRRLYPDGTPIAPAVDLGPDFVYYAPGLLWNGTGYAVSWLSGATGLVQFALLSPTGGFTYGPAAISSAAVAFYAGYGSVPVASSGSGYAVAWNDGRNYATQNFDIYATLLNSDGTIAGAGAYHDIAVGATPSGELFPALAWSLGAQKYLLAWEENSVTPVAIYRSLLNPADGTFSAPAALITSPGGAYQPKLAADPYGFLMVWGDGRNNATDSYFARLNSLGQVITVQTKAESAAPAYEPNVAWNGQEYGIFWNDGAGDGNNIWYQRVSAGGAAVGGNIQATQVADLRRASAAFGTNGYLVTGEVYGNGYSGANYAANFGCTADASAPTCPGNLLAYNVSGTQATLAWLPASDPESGIAYYQVYENNAPLAQTASATYAVTGLTQVTPYNFAVLPVNGRGVMNTACTASVYVKTTNAVTLTLGKSDPNAVLNWNDAGLNNYSIFRGTSPNVMSQIGATPNLTSPDPNVLNDTISYFYTVDDPGQ